MLACATRAATTATNTTGAYSNDDDDDYHYYYYYAAATTTTTAATTISTATAILTTTLLMLLCFCSCCCRRYCLCCYHDDAMPDSRTASRVVALAAGDQANRKLYTHIWFGIIGTVIAVQLLTSIVIMMSTGSLGLTQHATNGRSAGCARSARGRRGLGLLRV